MRAASANRSPLAGWLAGQPPDRCPVAGRRWRTPHQAITLRRRNLPCGQYTGGRRSAPAAQAQNTRAPFPSPCARREPTIAAWGCCWGSSAWSSDTGGSAACRRSGTPSGTAIAAAGGATP